MNVSVLRKGDVFVECSLEEWDTMTKKERLKLKPVKVLKILGPCRNPGQIHMETSAGKWCIHQETPCVLLVDEAKGRKAA